MSSYKEGQIHQLANALEEAGFTADDVTKLGQCRNLSSVRGFVRGELSIYKLKLLEPVSIIEIPVLEGKFIAANEFRTDRSDIKLWMSEYFQNNFPGKVEKGVQATVLRASKLLKNSRDSGIIAELCDKGETTLYHLFTLLMKQASGKPGDLLVNGYSNIFYIRDKKGILWAVVAGWRGDAWDLGACSFEDPRDWLAGRLVVSREVA